MPEPSGLLTMTDMPLDPRSSYSLLLEGRRQGLKDLTYLAGEGHPWFQKPPLSPTPSHLVHTPPADDTEVWEHWQVSTVLPRRWATLGDGAGPVGT